MKVLVVGSGGREHAVAWRLAKGPSRPDVYCAPGNPGIASVATCAGIAASDLEGLVSFAKRERMNLVVVGPEAPLVGGLADMLAAAGIPCFGPTQRAARLEGSKVFSKEFMLRHGIPTARAEVFDSLKKADDYVRSLGGPCVVKADGLAAGKGVYVCDTPEEAAEALAMVMGQKVHGVAGDRVVVEERLAGEEASVLAFCDGKRIAVMVASQDHKRAYDNDEGPNTGGMGAYAPAPVLADPVLAQRVLKEILEPTVAGMAGEGEPYRGVLYAGVMVCDGNPYLLEFNVRFGDPETQVVLPLLEGDLAEICLACAQGRLDPGAVRFSGNAAVCVVAASGGYPGAYEKGHAIEGLRRAASVDGVVVFHAGTARKGGEIVTAGGRVLGVTAVAPKLKTALARAYEAMSRISFSGMHYRKDIGARALARAGEVS